MNPEPKFINVAIYDPDHPLFLVALKTKNVPGALGDIATRLGHVGINLLSTSNYSLPDKPDSMLCFFAETKDAETGENEVRKVVMASPYVLDSHVKKSTSSFLVDDFDFPLMYFPTGRCILFPQSGMAAMFQEIVRLFGTGGESILFRAGYSVGKQGSDELAKLFGADEMTSNRAAFLGLFVALGWGRMEAVEVSADLSEFSLKLTDGFESEGVRASKPNCHFSRGLVVGSTEALFGRSFECEETKCSALGDPYCLFHVTPKVNE